MRACQILKQSFRLKKRVIIRGNHKLDALPRSSFSSEMVFEIRSELVYKSISAKSYTQKGF